MEGRTRRGSLVGASYSKTRVGDLKVGGDSRAQGILTFYAYHSTQKGGWPATLDTFSSTASNRCVESAGHAEAVQTINDP
ncbi:hypothetical protein WJX79_005440 [Trebouxia sp. C0005]